MMRLIGIDSQMIAKAKIWIMLYKDFLVSHSVSLEDKQRIYVESVDVSWFHGMFNAFFFKFSVCPKAFLY